MGSLSMGPSLGNQPKTTCFTGSKGGVGTSLAVALLARVAAGKFSKKIALVDAIPARFSYLPRYLSLSASSHHLAQLLPYSGHLSPKMVETFFSASPEGVAYAPLWDSDSGNAPLQELFPLLDQLSAFFDRLFLDLSSFPNDRIFQLAERYPDIVMIASMDPVSLACLGLWEKRFLAQHMDGSRVSVIYNQSGPSQTLPKDASSWISHLKVLSSLPYLGEGLSINLMESSALNPSVEKNLHPLCDTLFRTEKGSIPETTSARENQFEEAPPYSLEDVHQLHQKLLECLRAKGFLKEQNKGDSMERRSLEPKALEILDQLIHEMKLPGRETRQRLSRETMDLAFGLGPLEPLLEDHSVTEIMVNGPSLVYVEKKGLLEKSSARFLGDQQLRTVIERILAPIGRRIDESQPYVDGRLLDGSRVNAVIPPLSLNGPVLTIRKFSKKKLNVEDLIGFGSLTKEAADFLGACVRARKNIVVSGGTGSGKTTLLNVLSGFIPPGERIVTIEDSAELQLFQEHVVRLEARPANLEGKGQVAIRDLVINALRMRPDRIVVGEVRGGEALDMLQAMNTGHDGSLTTAHANTPRDVLSRLETMALFTGLELPLKAIREQIARAIHLVVQQSRLPNGRRSVTQISEVQGMEGDVITILDLFVYAEGQGLERKPFPPSFIADLKAAGYQWPSKGNL